MQRINLRKTLSAAALTGGTIVAASAQAQGGYGTGMGSGMMSGYGVGWMGEYGGILLPILLVVVVGLVAWVVMNRKK